MAYEMRISDWSSDVFSSDLAPVERRIDQMVAHGEQRGLAAHKSARGTGGHAVRQAPVGRPDRFDWEGRVPPRQMRLAAIRPIAGHHDRAAKPRLGQPFQRLVHQGPAAHRARSEEHLVGKECVFTFISRCSQYHSKNTKNSKLTLSYTYI